MIFVNWPLLNVLKKSYYLTVVLESTAAAPSFRGFLIQAQLVADDTTVVGRFEEPPVGGEYRYGSCANTEVWRGVLLSFIIIEHACHINYISCVFPLVASVLLMG